MKTATRKLMSALHQYRGRVSLSRSKITAFLRHDRRAMGNRAHRDYILSRLIEVP
jgi:RecG-like helicase